MRGETACPECTRHEDRESGCQDCAHSPDEISALCACGRGNQILRQYPCAHCLGDTLGGGEGLRSAIPSVCPECGSTRVNVRTPSGLVFSCVDCAGDALGGIA